MDDPDVVGATAIRMKCHEGSIRRPPRHSLFGDVIGKLAKARSVRPNQVDVFLLPGGVVGQPVSVWGEIWRDHLTRPPCYRNWLAGGLFGVRIEGNSMEVCRDRPLYVGDSLTIPGEAQVCTVGRGRGDRL